MTVAPVTWGFLGLFAGPWKLAIVAAVIALFYGRAIRPRLEQMLGVNLPRSRPASAPSQPVRGFTFADRTYILLVVVAATAVATWILAKYTITAATHSTP